MGGRQQVNYADADVAEEQAGLTSLFIHKGVDGDEYSTWYLDSGASNHMCGKKEMFMKFEKTPEEDVTFGDYSKVTVQGKGTILYKSKNGNHGDISDVYYVPAMKSNILSLGQLLEKGFIINMKDRYITLKDARGNLIARVEMTKNRLFPLTLRHDTLKCMKSVIKDESWLWHLRFGHLNFGGLKLLSAKNMVKGLPHIDHPNEVCEGCILGKHHRPSFSKEKRWRASRPLEIVHTDVCGPLKPASLGGNNYFLTFIDDFSRKTWVYFLKRKSEVFEVFKEFKNLVENQSGCRIKVLRSDQGGEYTSDMFEKFCRDYGIRH